MHLSSSSIIGDDVKNPADEDLGKIEDLMVNTDSGNVEYAVVSFGGVFGIGNKLFAVPLESMTINAEDKCFILNVAKERLENAPGFDKDHWPNMADPQWQNTIRTYYAN